MELSAGDIVYSKAGRDKDKFFIVLEVIDSEYVLLADGGLREVARPKKKKITLGVPINGAMVVLIQ